MRTTLLGDVVAAARVLLCIRPADHAAFIDQLLGEAHIAHHYAKRLGKPHPYWGNGSLMARAGMMAQKREPFTSDPAYLLALRSVIDGILRQTSDLKARGNRRTVDGPSVMLQGEKSRRTLMAEIQRKMSSFDPVWQRVCDEAVEAIRVEPLLGGLVHSSLLHHANMERALAYRFSLKLASGEMSEQILREIADEAYQADPQLGQAARADVTAVFDRDPACHRFLQPILFFKGYQAVQAYRVGHWLWTQGRIDLAYFVQMRVSEVFGVDIHPAAKIGRGIMIDHAHSIVIGETAVVGDNVSMLHSVTLGGTGKEDGDRHPKIGNGVMIGAGAKVLGNIHVGHCSRIAAGSVVLQDIPPCKTVAGVPARVVGEAGCSQPSITMDQVISGDL